MIIENTDATYEKALTIIMNIHDFGNDDVKYVIDMPTYESAMKNYILYEKYNSYGVGRVTYNPSYEYYTDRISGFTDYVTINIVDQISNSKILYHDTETGELRIGMNTPDYERLSKIIGEIKPMFRSIGKMSSRTSPSGVKQQVYCPDRIICIDLVRYTVSSLSMESD